MNNNLANTLTIMQEYREMSSQIKLIRMYQSKRKNRRLIISIYGAIAIIMPVMTWSLATIINLPCGIAATIILGVPLVKAKYHSDKLKQELQDLEIQYPFIEKNKNENCDELERKAEKLFLKALKNKLPISNTRQRHSTQDSTQNNRTQTKHSQIEKNTVPEQKTVTPKMKTLNPKRRRG